MVKKSRSSILGPDGEPIDASMLSKEIAPPERYGARALVYYSESAGLTPARLGVIMREANMGLAKPYLTLAVDMEERYLHYASQLQTRRLALDGVTISVSAPKGVNPKAVDFAESLISDPFFPDMISALQDGVGKGYSVVEPIWEYQDQALRPVAYKPRDARYFRYDEIGLDDLCLLQDDGRPGDKIGAPYFIKHEPFIRSGPPLRRGLARSAAWAYVMQTFALQDWASFCEIYGIPFRIGKYHPSATQQDKATLLRAVRSISNDAAAIIPEGMQIDFQETSGNRGEAVFGNFIDYLDRKVSLIVIGQTLTAEVGSSGSLAQAKVHESVRNDIVRADARQTAATLNRDLLRPAIAMNFGPQAVYPILQLEMADNEDLAALGDFLDKSVKNGLKVSQKYVRSKAGIPEPEPDDELMGAAPAPAPAPNNAPAPVDPKPQQLATLSCTCPNCGAPPRATQLAADDPTAVTALDDTDALVDEALADWREVRDPLLAELLSAVATASSFEEALANIEKARIYTGPLAQRMTIATLKAAGLGDVRD